MKILLLLVATATSSLAFADTVVPPGPQIVSGAQPGSLQALKNRAAWMQMQNETITRAASKAPLSWANQQALYRSQHAGFAPKSFRQLSNWAQSTRSGTQQGQRK